MARKKSNRASLEEHKKAYRQNQAVIARTMAQNAELEQVIAEEENREIVGIIRRYRIGIDHLEQIMQGVRPAGESLFSEEKDKPVSGTDAPEKKPRKESRQASGPAADKETEKEETQRENE